MNYHLLIVDELSLAFHIEYGFLGTGNGKGSFNIGLWKDIARLQKNDKIIFYVQSIKKFYGVFKVISTPFYDKSHFLQPVPMPYLGPNKIILQYRALIAPDKVFANGIEEFDLIDILPVATRDVLWSILYRKLKGARGCSPIFEAEYNAILKQLSLLNKNVYLSGKTMSFKDRKIIKSNVIKKYNGSIKNRHSVKNDILRNHFKESHLHALLLEKVPSMVFGKPGWFGNEVYSGAGMQAIDLLSIENDVYSIIEVKKDEISGGITIQIEKYLKWIKYRFDQHNCRKYQPIVIGSQIKGCRKQNLRKNEFTQFNQRGVALKLRYIEYSINSKNQYIKFNEIDYINNWAIIGSQVI
jgi:hypothetical protein